MTDSTETARVHTEDVELRRSPKYGSFMALGAGVGVVVGVALSLSQPVTGSTSIGQIVAFMALVLGVVGIAAGAATALIVDRVFAKRAQVVEVQRTTVDSE